MNITYDNNQFSTFLADLKEAKQEFDQKKNEPLKFSFIYTIFKFFALYPALKEKNYKILPSLIASYICTSWFFERLKSIHISYNVQSAAKTAKAVSEIFRGQMDQIDNEKIKGAAKELIQESSEFYAFEEEHAQKNINNKIKEIASTIFATFFVFAISKSVGLGLIAFSCVPNFSEGKNKDNPKSLDFAVKLNKIEKLQRKALAHNEIAEVLKRKTDKENQKKQGEIVNLVFPDIFHSGLYPDLTASAPPIDEIPPSIEALNKQINALQDRISGYQEGNLTRIQLEQQLAHLLKRIDEINILAATFQKQ